MIFKKYFKIINILIISVALSSCTEFLKGKEKKEEVIEIKQEATTGCLKDISLDMQKFLRSESTNEEIDNTFKCIDETLSLVQKRVEGKAEASAFTSEELYEIFEKFIKDAQISKAAVDDILVLKTALIGGGPQKLTKAELSQLKDFLILIKAEAKNLLPYAQLFTFKKADVAFSQNMIKDGFAQLNLSLKNLLKASKLAHSSYAYEDFKRLIISLHFLDDNQEGMLELADKVNSLLSGTQGAISEDDRAIYVDNLTEVLRLYSVFTQGYVKFEISNSASLNQTLDFIRDAVILLENSLQFRKTNLIADETIDPLLTHVLEKGLIPLKLTQPTALTFYKTILTRAFDLGLNGDVTSFSGVKKVHITNIKREVAIYKIYTQFIDQLAGDDILRERNVKRLPLAELQQKLRAMNAADQREILKDFDRDTQNLIVRIVEELKSEFLQKPVLYRNKKLVLAVNQEIWDQNWEDLQRNLYVKMLSRQLILGWGNAPLAKEVKNSYITKQGMVQWYSEFKNFGLETKSFDPRIENDGGTSLIAANLFTRAGNGDDKMSFLEATQSFAILISSGGQTYLQMSQGIEASHCALPELDVFQNHWTNEACFYQDMRTNYKKYFSNMSYLVGFLDRLNDQQFKEFLVSVIDISRKDMKNKGQRLETSDIKGMNTMLYFVESLFAAHDTNRNWKLSETEIKAAYPKFKAFATDFANSSSQDQIKSFTSWKGWIASYSCFSADDLVRESFVFMIYNGRTPKLGDLTILPCLRHKPLLQFTGEVDRKMIINTLKILKSVISS